MKSLYEQVKDALNSGMTIRDIKAKFQIGQGRIDKVKKDLPWSKRGKKYKVSTGSSTGTNSREGLSTQKLLIPEERDLEFGISFWHWVARNHKIPNYRSMTILEAIHAIGNTYQKK